MEFVVYLIQMLVKMVLIGAASFGGILIGKKLRDNKSAKSSADQK